MKRRLPIGVQTFGEIRTENCYYVDKTAHIAHMAETGKCFFLSRPRRFGKSLLLDTIRELFKGSEPLFRGLHIHDRWDWSKRHPVIRLHFTDGGFTRAGDLADHLDVRFGRLEAKHGAPRRHEAAWARFGDLVEALHHRAGERVVVLVDEYDKPILDALAEPEIAAGNRELLRGLYSVIKGHDRHIRFSFLTGVSKFSKVSLFSGLNNLEDITLDPRYSSVCGYTDEDLDRVFAPELQGLDRKRVREWYNGYNWRGAVRVYNPFDVLLLFDRREFRDWWFETGSPQFLIDTLRERGVLPLDLDGVSCGEARLSAFDVGAMEPEALLFQTGYLTIIGEDEDGFRLGYPNLEVRRSLNDALLKAIAWPTPRSLMRGPGLARLLRAGDLEGLEQHLRALFAGIPHDWHRRNDLARIEGYWASVFYALLAALDVEHVVEDASASGRADLTAIADGHIYVFEFKVGGTREAALAQIRDRDYAAKYRARGLPIHLVGIAFDPDSRVLSAFATETLPPG